MMKSRQRLSRIIYFTVCAIASLLISVSPRHSFAAEGTPKNNDQQQQQQQNANDNVLIPVRHEINTTFDIRMVTNPIYSRQTYSSGGFESSKTDYATEIGFRTSYNYTVLSPYLQLGGEFGFGYSQKHLNLGLLSTNGHQFTLSLLLGPTINFGAPDVRSTYFVAPRIGVVGTLLKDLEQQFPGTTLQAMPGSGSHNTAAFAYGCNVGKRFSLNQYVSYTPSVGVAGTVRSELKTVAVVANVLSFSFFPGSR